MVSGRREERRGEQLKFVVSAARSKNCLSVSRMQEIVVTRIRGTLKLLLEV